MNREDKLSIMVSRVTDWKSFEGLHNGDWHFTDNELCNPLYKTITIDDWNRAKIVPNTKVRILSPEHSEYVQRFAFEVGFMWAFGGRNTNHKDEEYLFFWDDKDITYSDKLYFDQTDKKEIFIELPVKNESPEIEKNFRCTPIPDINARILAEKVGSKHGHYFKDVSDLDEIDVYRICDLCEVNDSSGATQHAVKKLLCAGQRGAKDKRKDLEEARDTIIRKLAMMTEDNE